jgi:hypothetical protein
MPGHGTSSSSSVVCIAGAAAAAAPGSVYACQMHACDMKMSGGERNAGEAMTFPQQAPHVMPR